VPQTVQFGDTDLQLEFPDELSRDQIAEIIKRQTPQLLQALQQQPPKTPAPPPPDELGIGEEIRGIGRAAARGVNRFLQQQSVQGLRSIDEQQRELEHAKQELAEFDKQFPDPAMAPPMAQAWRQNQLTKVGIGEHVVGLAQKKAPALAESFVTSQKAIEALPPTTAEAEFQRPETSAWSFFRNPVEIGLTTTAESLPSMVPAVIGSVFGPAGTAAGAGMASFGAESSARVIKGMQDEHVDLKDPTAVLAWFQNKAKMDPITAKADLAALGPASFDALTGGLAGRFLSRAVGGGVRKVAGATAKEIGMQMAGGGLGSIAANTLAGEDIDWKDVLLEMAAEVAPGEAISNIREDIGARRQQRRRALGDLIQEVQRAQRIRARTGQAGPSGRAVEAGQAPSGNILEPQPSQQPQPVAPREETTPKVELMPVPEVKAPEITPLPDVETLAGMTGEQFDQHQITPEQIGALADTAQREVLPALRQIADHAAQQGWKKKSQFFGALYEQAAARLGEPLEPSANRPADKVAPPPELAPLFAERGVRFIGTTEVEGLPPHYLVAIYDPLNYPNTPEASFNLSTTLTPEQMVQKIEDVRSRFGWQRPSPDTDRERIFSEAESVAQGFMNMVNFEAREPEHAGAPFIEDLPANRTQLANRLATGGRVPGRTETLRFAFVRDNASGDVHLLPVRKNTKRAVTVRLPGQQSGAGVALKEFLATKQEDGSDRYTVLSSVLMKNPGDSFPRAFTQTEYEAIAQAARDEISKIGAQEQHIGGEEAVTAAEQVAAAETRQAPELASGLSPATSRELFDIGQRLATNQSVDALIRSNTALFRRVAQESNWDAATFLHQYELALTHENFDEFLKTLDPIGYTPTKANVGARIPGSRATSPQPGVAPTGPTIPAGSITGPAAAIPTAPTAQPSVPAGVGVRESVTGTAPAVSVTEEDAQAAIDDWSARHPNAPAVQLVDDIGMQRMTRDGMRGIRGMFVGNTILINRAYIGSGEEVSQVLDHEHAHNLLRSSAGQSAIETAIRNSIGADQYEAISAKYPQRPDEDADTYRARVIEEWLAQLSETQPALWQRIISAVRVFLARFGLANLSDEEVGRAILRSLRNETGAAGSVTLESLAEGKVPKVTKEDFAQAMELRRQFLELANSGQVDSPEFLRVWQESENLKNKYGGMMLTDPRLERESLTEYVVGNIGERTSKITQAREAGAPQAGISEFERVAQVQAGMIPQTYVNQIAQLAGRRPGSVESRTRKLLKFIEDLANVTLNPRQLSSMPRNTPEQTRQAELAAGTLLTHHLFIRDAATDYTRELEAAEDELDKAVREIPKAQAEDAESAFAHAIAENLITSYRDYLENVKQTATASGNVNLALDKLLDKGIGKATEMHGDLSSIGRALNALAETAPNHLLAPAGGQSAAAIVQWARQSNALAGKAGPDVRRFLLEDTTLPGSPQVVPAVLSQYQDLASDLLQIRQVQHSRGQMAQEIADFKAWFAGTRKPSAVGARRFATEYYRIRKQKELAAQVAARINRNVDQADARVRSLTEALAFLDQMTTDPEYQANVQLASELSNAIVQRLASVNAAGQTTFIGPQGGTYVLDFRPDRIPSEQSLQHVQALLTEIENFSADPASDPLLVRSWENQKEYLELYLLNSFATPQTGGPLSGWLDIYDWWNRGALVRRLTSPQNFLNRMASKAAQMVALTFQAADAFLEPLKVVNENAEYGMRAIQNLGVAAATAHGFDPSEPRLFAKYEFLILDPLLATLQNNLTAPLTAGQQINGKYTILPEDIALVRAMHKWASEIQKHANPGREGSPALRFTPLQPQAKVGGTVVSRKPIGTGSAVMPRVASHWGSWFSDVWTSAAQDPAVQIAMLDDESNFAGAVLGRVNETNPEYGSHSELQKYYKKAREDMRAGHLRFNTFNDLVSWLTSERQNAIPATTEADIREIIRAEVDADVRSFQTNYLSANVDDQYLETIPESLRSLLTGKNSFTSPREGLSAPSTYYSYSMATGARQAQYVASGRLVFELRQLQALDQLRQTLRTKLNEYDAQIAKGQTPAELRRLRRSVGRQSLQAVRAGETFVTYQELRRQVEQIETLMLELKRLAQREYDEPNHVAIGTAQSATGLEASMLLSLPQPSLTNLSGGSVFAPALIRLRMGKIFPALATAFSSPGRLIQLASARVAQGIRNRPALAGLWAGNRSQWGAVARTIADAAEYYSNIYQRALSVGGVSPYDLRGRMKLLRDLKPTLGRLETSEPSAAMRAINRLSTIPFISQAVSAVKAVSPRWVDQVVNLMNTQEAMATLTQLKEYGFNAWRMREQSGRPNWQDLTLPENLLTPPEIGVPTHKGATFLRQLFNSAGNLDKILLDYYQRTKGMTEEQRADEPLMDDEGAVDAYLLEYLKATNLATQSNRPPAFRGGALRPLLSLFLGYPAALGEQVSELTRRHSRDVGPENAARNVAIITTMLVMAVVAGMMAREPGQELTEVVTGRASGQLRLPNVLGPEAGAQDLARYSIVSSANILPWFGEVANRSIGGVASKPFLDITSMIPAANFLNDTGNSFLKMATSGDPIYPAADWGRRWFPPLSPFLNRLPAFSGDISHRNAMAVLRATAPPGMEVKQVFGGGAPRQTPVSPIIRDLISAAYVGDTDGIRRAYQAAIEEKRREGTTDPERSIWQTLQGRIPARQVFGRLPTLGEESLILRRMTEGQRDYYARSKAAFDLIGGVTGQKVSFIDESLPGRPRTSRTRRARGTRRTSLSTRRRGLGSLPRRRRIGFGKRRSFAA
jgi:hypothetical protein